MSYEGMAWIDRDLEGAIANQETWEALAALAGTALIGTVRVGLGKVSAEVAGLVRVLAEQTERQSKDNQWLREEVAELAAAVNQQTRLLAKIHRVSLDDLYPQGEEMGG